MSRQRVNIVNDHRGGGCQPPLITPPISLSLPPSSSPSVHPCSHLSMRALELLPLPHQLVHGRIACREDRGRVRNGGRHAEQRPRQRYLRQPRTMVVFWRRRRRTAAAAAAAAAAAVVPMVADSSFIRIVSWSSCVELSILCVTLNCRGPPVLDMEPYPPDF